MFRASFARIRAFRRTVWNFYRTNGRHELPWRLPAGRQGKRDPYRILVSEIMLQQTQVERVQVHYGNWLKKFPTVRALANAPLSEVLKSWQGLGYNRRAKMLHDAAKEIVEKYHGVFPKDAAALETLRGVGPYTARAIAAFAYNADGIFIETNIRTVVTYHFFPRKKKVTDAEVLKLLEETYPRGRAREWYAALMDYGSHLKRSGVRINAKAKGYVKQSMFRGSAREARGAILKVLTKGSCSRKYLEGILGPNRREQVMFQLMKLTKEGMVELRGNLARLPA